jgi:PAS domain S-box-containing protein
MWTEEPIARTAAGVTALGMAFVIETRADRPPLFAFAGPRCLAVNGVSGAAAMADASSVFDRILPEHRKAFFAALSQGHRTGEALDIEVAMRCPDEEVRWRRFAATPRPQPDGSVLWDGLQIDVTDRRLMAADLAEQRWRLEMAAEATGLGFWEWDVAAGSVRWSGRNRELFGLKPDEEINVARYLELVHPDDRDAVRQAFASARDKPTGGDYSLEHRIVTPAGELRWILTNGRVITGEGGQARLVVGTSLDVTERKARDERRNLVMGELAHRAKNGISVMMAIVHSTARTQETVEAYREVLLARLQAMADSLDLVTAAGGRAAPLNDVIGKAIAPFGKRRFDLDPALADVTLRGDMAAGMGLLLHEMATNAVKHGALSRDRGRVEVAVEAVGPGRAAFRWREVGGPKVKPSGRTGFGTRLLQQVLRPQGGEVKFEFKPEGFRASVEFPAVM